MKAAAATTGLAWLIARVADLAHVAIYVSALGRGHRMWPDASAEGVAEAVTRGLARNRRHSG